jgi:4-hydroxy-2-oxoheptanedioate aldolase
MLLENVTKRRLAAGETVVGCFVRYPEGTLAELVALAGWDFVVLDAEHGSLQPRDVEDLSRASELHGVTPIVRVTGNERPTILRFLDAGAHGIHVPWVDSAEAAEAAVQAAKYQPRGSRGLAATRAARFGVPEPIGAYVARANQETLIVVQAETAAAVERIDEYLGVDGVDVIFIGPADLSNSLGHTGDASHPEVRAAMERIAAAVVPSRKALGIFVATPEDAVAWRERGARYIATGLEPLLNRSMRSFLDELRDRQGESG